MSKSGILAAFLLGSFILYLAANDRLATYVRIVI